MNIKAIIEQTIKIGIYIYIVLLPWQTRLIIRPGEIAGGYSEYLALSLYATDLLLMGLLALGALLSLRAERSNPEADRRTTGLFRLRARNDRFTMAFLLFLAWCALTILWAPDKALAVQLVLRLALAGGLAFLAFRFGVTWRKLAWAFLLGLALPAGLAIAQFFFQEAWPNKWLGLAAHAPYELGRSVIETDNGSLGSARGGRWLRAYGPFDHPNILGAAMVLALLLAGRLLARETRPLFRYALIVLTPLYFAALFFSFSRAAWLALAAGLAVLLASQARRRDLRAQKAVLYFILVIGAQFFVFNDVADELVRVRLGQSARLEQKSLDQRAASLAEGWAVIKDRPVLGAGAGNYIAKLAQTRPGRPAWDYQPPHNVLWLIWAELGLVGLALFLYLGYLSLKKGSIMTNLAFIFPIFILFMLDHWWFSLHFGLLMLAFWCIITRLNINNIK